MEQTISEILSFVNENDIKFIRLQFCDIFGDLKNISIMSSQLEKAFKYGISFDASSIKGFLDVKNSDLFLVPDPTTITILPWRPQEGRVARFFCYIKTSEGEIFQGDCRNILNKTVEELIEKDYTVKIGPESEFYLFKTDEDAEPLLEPQDKAGYFDIAPYDKGENIRREVCLTLEEMGVEPESSHHESGPGQNEIDFKFDNPLESADNFVTLKSVVKTIASLNGLYASFIPKPFIDKSGSGFHINLSLYKGDKNVFISTKDNKYSDEAESFIAGILYRINELTAILNPIVNSYRRFGTYEAPKNITWSYKGRDSLIRIPAASGNYSRMELRSADCVCNPYLAFTLLIKAGIEGIEKKKKLSEIKYNNEDMENIMLPDNLNDALTLLKNSIFVKEALGEFIFEKFITEKEKEWESFISKNDNLDEVTSWEISNYFYKY